MRRRTLLPLLLALTACAAPRPPYALPPGALQAELQGDFGYYDLNDSATVSIRSERDGKVQYDPVFVARFKSVKPDNYVPVEAGRPLTIVFNKGASGGRTCQLSVTVLLMPGKRYTLVAHDEFKEGLIPILSTTRHCTMRVRDDGTGETVPMIRM